MNTQTQEALKMAIEALQNISESLTEKQVWFSSNVYEAINACKQALEQPSQEPVAWMNDKTPEGIFARHKQGADNFGCTIPLYTHPAQPLGDDEITAIFVRHGLDNVEMAGNHIDVVLLMRDVEQAHGIGVKE